MTSSFSSRSRKHLLAAALALASLGACAQPSAPAQPDTAAGMPQGRHMTEHGSRMKERQARHLDALKSKLQLTAAQEGAWKSFAAAVQERPAPMAAHGAQHQALTQLSTPERLERMKALRAQHQAEMNAHMDRRMDATRSFYATLTTEQQKVFDAETGRMMQGMGRGGEHRHGPHHGRG